MDLSRFLNATRRREFSFPLVNAEFVEWPLWVIYENSEQFSTLFDLQLVSQWSNLARLLRTGLQDASNTAFGLEVRSRTVQFALSLISFVVTVCTTSFNSLPCWVNNLLEQTSAWEAKCCSPSQKMYRRFITAFTEAHLWSLSRAVFLRETSNIIVHIPRNPCPWKQKKTVKRRWLLQCIQLPYKNSRDISSCVFKIFVVF